MLSAGDGDFGLGFWKDSNLEQLISLGYSTLGTILRQASCCNLPLEKGVEKC